MAQDLEDFLAELETLVRDEIFKADQRANEHRAPESYRCDMQGYSRGVSIWGLKVINMTKEKFCFEEGIDTANSDNQNTPRG